MDKKIVKLNGGLGNQMFQYAFACALAKKFSGEVLFDFSYFDEVSTDENVVIREFALNAFNAICKRANEQDLAELVRKDNRSFMQKLLWIFFRIKKYKPEKNVFTQKSAYSFNKNLFKSAYYYYDGYFQNEKYFKHVRNDVLKEFTLNIPLDEKNQVVLEKISETNSVSIHIRRGDYVNLESANKFHGTCSVEYYEKAIEYVARKIKNPHFFLFSDDIDWVIKNIKINYPYTVVDFNQEKAFFDLELMKRCRHNIVANSSFSWWGAWLNDNKGKIVVAPKKWILQKIKIDIIPKDWVKI